MRIDQLGELTVDEEVEEWLVSKRIDIPCFPGVKLRFVFDSLEGDDRPDEHAAAVARFLALTTRDRDHAATYVFKNYRDTRDAIGDDDVGVEINGPAEIWDHVRLDEIIVSRRSDGDCKVYVQITAECKWEPEHGLQIVYRDGSQLSRVSQQDGHLTHADAYGLPESEDRIA